MLKWFKASFASMVDMFLGKCESGFLMHSTDDGKIDFEKTMRGTVQRRKLRKAR